MTKENNNQNDLQSLREEVRPAAYSLGSEMADGPASRVVELKELDFKKQLTQTPEHPIDPASFRLGALVALEQVADGYTSQKLGNEQEQDRKNGISREMHVTNVQIVPPPLNKGVKEI